MARAGQIKKFEARGQYGLGFAIEEMCRIPESRWQPPDMSNLPDRLAGDIGVDTESRDNGLNAGEGPGWPWPGGGHVCGYSITADNFSGYFPIGHEGEGNLDPDQVKRWLNHVLSDVAQPKIYANALYDIPWAAVDGVHIKGPIIDIQLMEALLDEHRKSYSLDNIALDHVSRGKDETLLRRAAEIHGYDSKGEIYRLHPKYVGDYALEDSVLPREIWKVQKPLIESEGLTRIAALEHALLPMYTDMRRRGVRINLDRAEQLKDQLEGEIAEQIALVKHGTGLNVSIWEPESLAAVLTQMQIQFPRTPVNRQPSITNDLLENARHWITDALLKAREKDKLVNTFIKGQILDAQHDGRVHGSIHPLRGEDIRGSGKRGAVTGRLSMSNPNLMFIPKKTVEGRLIRECFIPEAGEEWASIDFDQQEVRLLVHFAVLASRLPWNHMRGLQYRLKTAMEAQQKYIDDPKRDYHKMVAEFTGLSRNDAKQLNFAIIYGRGISETAAAMEISFEEAKELFEKHASKLPFARAMADATQDVVTDRGYVTTLLGRRQRFPLWEPRDWTKRDSVMLRYDEAKKRWPNEQLVRARIHKALNSVIQPSAADQTKRAMLDVWEAGLGHHVSIQIHDELNASVPDPKIAEQISEIMINAVKLEVPVMADIAYGDNWGTAH